CPFHGFCFNSEGECVATGYGSKPPASARLAAWPTREINGIIMAWYHPRKEPPTWSVPELDGVGWTPLIHRSKEIWGHPQETTENSVDLGHFSHVHGYEDVRVIQPLRTEGPYLTGRYGFS